MKNSKIYVGCESAATAEAKIVFTLESEIITTYFDTIDNASDYLHNWLGMEGNELLPMTYEYYTRHYNWESGCRYNTWDWAESGKTANSKIVVTA